MGMPNNIGNRPQGPQGPHGPSGPRPNGPGGPQRPGQGPSMGGSIFGHGPGGPGGPGHGPHGPGGFGHGPGGPHHKVHHEGPRMPFGGHGKHHHHHHFGPAPQNDFSNNLDNLLQSNISSAPPKVQKQKKDGFGEFLNGASNVISVASQGVGLFEKISSFF